MLKQKKVLKRDDIVSKEFPRFKEFTVKALYANVKEDPKMFTDKKDHESSEI